MYNGAYIRGRSTDRRRRTRRIHNIIYYFLREAVGISKNKLLEFIRTLWAPLRTAIIAVVYYAICAAAEECCFFERPRPSARRSVVVGCICKLNKIYYYYHRRNNIIITRYSMHARLYGLGVVRATITTDDTDKKEIM